MKKIQLLVGSFFLSLLPFTSQALVINEYSVFLNTSSLGADSLLYSPIGTGDNDFLGSGIDVSFTDNLDADGFGTVTWDFTNNTGVTLANTQLIVLLDAEIDQTINTFFNEYGQLVDVSGTGSGDNLADSWEIDEPGFIFGDIFDNALLGALDNSNSVAEGAEDDVSLALGFELGDLFANDTWSGTFTTSALNIGGLSHTDPDSLSTFFFNGLVNVDTASPVPGPGSLLLILLALPVLLLPSRSK